MPDVTFREANWRYRRLFWPVMGAYCILCFGVPVLLKITEHPPRWLFAVAALTNAAPIAVVLWLINRWLRETDEYTRKVQSEALLTGGFATIALTVTWSFLELYRVVPRWEHVPSLMMVGPAFFGLYGVSYYFQIRRLGIPCSEAPQSGRDAL